MFGISLLHKIRDSLQSACRVLSPLDCIPISSFLIASHSRDNDHSKDGVLECIPDKVPGCLILGLFQQTVGETSTLGNLGSREISWSESFFREKRIF